MNFLWKLKISLQESCLFANVPLSQVTWVRLRTFPRTVSIMKVISWKELPSPDTVTGTGEVMTACF